MSSASGAGYGPPAPVLHNERVSDETDGNQQFCKYQTKLSFLETGVFRDGATPPDESGISACGPRYCANPCLVSKWSVQIPKHVRAESPAQERRQGL